jgi:hypothetical protein
MSAEENRRHKQKGDAVQSVAGSVDTVNRKMKAANRFSKPPGSTQLGRHAAVWFRRSGEPPWRLTLRHRRNGKPLLGWPSWSLDKPS